MEELQSIQAQITDKKRYVLRTLGWMVVWIAFTALPVWMTQQFAIALAGLLVACLPPVLFEKTFKKGLMKKAWIGMIVCVQGVHQIRTVRKIAQ